jgi:peptidoglycan/xylan/chitin deacetylase (PgdA/CDA1 family)
MFAAAIAAIGAIFMYHHVSPAVQPGIYQRALTVSPAEFEGQLRWLRSRGCELVTVDRIWADAVHHALSRCEAAVTFDDGYADVARYALPLLQRYGANATFYIATGFVGSSGHMTVADLRAAQRRGIEIGAHTVHHVDLARLPSASAAREIDESQSALQRWLAAPVTTFAYPAGSYNRSVEAALARAHFATAVTTQPGTLSASDDAYALPRYRVVHGRGLGLLAGVFAQADRSPASWTALEHIARERIEGNDPKAAEAVAVALLARRFPEQIMKVHAVALTPATVVGIVLSGVKFHAAVNRGRFAQDVREMIDTAFGAAPAADEVDVWAVVPIGVPAGAIVSGDYAASTERTVFSAAMLRSAYTANSGSLGVTYWYSGWL